MGDLASKLILEADRPRIENDKDYDARATVGDKFADEMRIYRETSEAVRPKYLSFADVIFDDASGQSLDIFGVDPSLTKQPVFVFIHGGYWRALSKLDSAMMAGNLAEQGIATIAIDYQLAPAVTLNEIVREVRAAIAFIWREGVKYGVDPEQINIGGSSAGGHLAAMVLAGGWHQEFEVPLNVVKSAFLISGLFELAPIMAGFPREWLSLTQADVHALSPIRHMPSIGCPIVVSWAEGEAAGFTRQSLAFHQVWTQAGYSSQMYEIPDCNHFNALVELADKDSVLAKMLVGLIKRAK